MVQYGVESENGWRPAKATPEQCIWVSVPGTDVTIQVLRGDPEVVLPALLADINAYIEPLRDADTACWTPTNSVPTSNHLNATACDCNWNSHPFHVVGTFNAAQMAVLRELLAFYTWDGLKIVFWAGDWKNPVDEMHWQMGYDTWNDKRVQAFIAARIRADGFSTFRRGGVARGGSVAAPSVPASGGLTPAVLATVMDNRVSMARYIALAPRVLAAFGLAHCDTLARRRMMLAQIGHESGGLKYQQEIASGEAYNGRTDLGNTQPGDGPRFKGRDFIQITGRSNYTRLSQWAYDNEQVPTPTWFVDHPETLATDEYAFLGVVWYWTVARPQLNALSDANDMVGATRAINGGTNGLEDRRAFYARAMAAGDALLDLTDYDDLENDMALETSRSLYRTSNAKTMTAADAARGADATSHMNWVEAAAIRGESWAIDIVRATALGQGPGATKWWEANADNPNPAVDPWAVQHATNVLLYIQATNPAALQAYLGGK